MKKILLAIMVAVLSVSTAFALTACKDDDATYVTITYELNGGTLATTSEKVNVEDFTLPTPTKAGYTFTGWTLNGDLFTENNLLVQDVTLVATWSMNQFTVTLDAGVSGTVANTTITCNAIGYELPTPVTVPGASFSGWTLNGEPFSTSTVLTSNITLVAAYEVTAYTVTFEYSAGVLQDGDGNQIASNSQLLSVSDYVLPVVARDCYNFDGWTLNGTAFDGSATLTGNITLVAKFTPKTYNIYYFASEDAYNTAKSNNFANVSDTDATKVDVQYNAAYTLNSATPITGNTFVGWNGTVGNLETSNFTSGMWNVNGNAYLYPVYVKDTFKIIWDAGEGSFTSGKTVTKVYNVLDKATVTMLTETVTCGDKPFTAWKYGTETVTADNIVTIVANAEKDSEFTFVAEWDQNKYVIYRFGDKEHKVVAATNTTYDLTGFSGVEGYQASGDEIFTTDNYHHLEFTVNGQKYVDGVKFDTETDITTTVIEAKVVANSVNVKYVIWGPNNGDALATGTMNDEILNHGDTVSECAFIGKGTNTFVGWSTIAWYDGNSCYTLTDIIDNDGKIMISDAIYNNYVTSGTSLTLYAVFHQSVIS